MQTQDTLIKKAKAEIENQVGWGKSENWTNQDFHALSELILTKTGSRLSAVTLKRIWGRIKYSSIPSTNTLDILVNFVDYGNWRDFKVNHSNADPVIASAKKARIEERIPSFSPYQSLSKPSFLQRGLWLILLIALQYSAMLFLERNFPVIAPEHSLSRPKVVTEKVRKGQQSNRMDFYKGSVDTLFNQHYRKQSPFKRVSPVKPKPGWLLPVDAHGKHILLEPRT